MRKPKQFIINTFFTYSVITGNCYYSERVEKPKQFIDKSFKYRKTK